MELDILTKHYIASQERSRRYLHRINALEDLETQLNNNLSTFREKCSVFSEHTDVLCDFPPMKRNKFLDSSISRLSLNDCKDSKPIYNLEPVKKDGKITIKLNCSQYNPELISIKIREGKLHINAQHESKQEDSYEYFEIKKVLKLPENVDAESVISRLSKSGMLYIEIPLSKQENINIPLEKVSSTSVESK